MAMDFWEAQRRARKQTTIYLALFALLALLAAAFIEFGLRYFSQGQYDPPTPIFGLLFLGLTLLAALFEYGCFCVAGGSYVATSMGGRLADAENSAQEAQLLNIVSECAIASSLPIPEVYIIKAEQINAFAAGISPDKAVIGITTGALAVLSRDEIQAVVAHEFGHISNGDMKIGLRLAAMLMGFYFMLYIAIKMIQLSGGREARRSNDKNGLSLVAIALVLAVAGALSWLFGSMLKAAVSRQREYLADASSVQFTRNPEGLVSALKKIEKEAVTNDMPRSGMAFSHLYLDNRSRWSFIFATHPPLKKRIEAIEGSVD